LDTPERLTAFSYRNFLVKSHQELWLNALNTYKVNKREFYPRSRTQIDILLSNPSAQYTIEKELLTKLFIIQIIQSVSSGRCEDRICS
jgi:hypothetical protein